ncbi:MAG: hypothetical protein KDB23_22925, partial [Planctomycetales bacterium]|nr:hypothetical protein [Planctomycetales bacterium]
MRLTLRTLLAYLDRILEPRDAQELEQKVQESDIANQLVKRIHRVLAAKQPEALPLDAQGLGRNANSVAEYLDNTLPPQEVPDFERVCLDSDAQLAEVAACHQILTLVLGEPAAFDSGLKQQIYRLDPRTAAAEPASAPTADAAPAARWVNPTQPGEAARRVDPAPPAANVATAAKLAAGTVSRALRDDEDE